MADTKRIPEGVWNFIQDTFFNHPSKVVAQQDGTFTPAHGGVKAAQDALGPAPSPGMNAHTGFLKNIVNGYQDLVNGAVDTAVEAIGGFQFPSFKRGNTWGEIGGKTGMRRNK